MTLPPIKYKSVKLAVPLFIGILFGSWVAGQIRSCHTNRKPKPAKPVPGYVSAGEPVAGPVAQAPTVKECLPVARPDLTRKEVLEYARKYGLTLEAKAQVPLELTTLAPKPVIGQEAAVVPTLSGSQPSEEIHTYPFLLSEESFTDFRSKAAVDVSAWLPGADQRLDLRARWHDWTPPPVPVCATQLGYLGNEAKWHKEIFAGYVCGPQGCGLGGGGGFSYAGPRIGAITLGAHAIGAYSPQSGGVGFAGASITW